MAENNRRVEKGPGKNEATVPKDKFPTLLKKLCSSLREENVVAGFKKCGIAPLNRNKVLSMLPGTSIIDKSQETETQQQTDAIDNSFKELLQSMRQEHTSNTNRREKRTKINVLPGKSISSEDFEGVAEEVDPQTSIVDSTGSNDPKPCSSKQVQSSSKKSSKITKRLDSSSEDDNDYQYSLHDSDEELILSTRTSEEEERTTGTGNPSDADTCINPGDYMVVKVYGKTKNTSRCYVCQVNYLEDDGFVGTFLKRVSQTNKFTMTEEDSLISREDVIKKLSSPILRSSSHFKNTLLFKEDLSDVTIY